MNDSQKWAEKQLTKEEAIAFAKMGAWKTWTSEQIVRFQLFQKKMCMDFSDFHKAIEEVLNRPVFTHEFAYIDSIKLEYLGEKEAPSWEEIVDLIPEEKRFFIGI